MKVNQDLELSSEQMQQMVEAAMQKLVAFVESLPEQPVDASDQQDEKALRALAEPLPNRPTEFSSLLNTLFDVAPNALNPASPGFMGYVPGGGLFHAAVADLISNTLNRYVGVASVAPAMVQLESNVVRWFCEIMGYSNHAGGFLTSGGSLANLSALITARHVRLGEHFSDGVIYISDQAHHCLEKAARFAGFPARNFRTLPVDAEYRLDAETVRAAIAEDRAQGLKPFLVAGSAGTTNTGAIDPLVELADLAEQEGLWFHVDGAYGGFFRMTQRGHTALEGIERADSIVLDPHKTLFLPYGTGALIVRNREHLVQTHTSEADYMPEKGADSELMDFCELSPELTRPFRGLRIWLPFKMHGADTFAAYLDEKLDLTRWIESAIDNIPELEILARPELSILAFAVRDSGEQLEVRNSKTRRLQKLINERQRVNLTSTLLNGVFAIRIAVGGFRTHQDRMEMLLEDLLAALDQLDVKSESLVESDFS